MARVELSGATEVQLGQNITLEATVYPEDQALFQGGLEIEAPNGEVACVEAIQTGDPETFTCLAGEAKSVGTATFEAVLREFATPVATDTHTVSIVEGGGGGGISPPGGGNGGGGGGSNLTLVVGTAAVAGIAYWVVRNRG